MGAGWQLDNDFYFDSEIPSGCPRIYDTVPGNSRETGLKQKPLMGLFHLQTSKIIPTRLCDEHTEED